MDFILLYFHILLACVWIGGMITLIGYVVYAKGEKDKFFYRFAAYYGWLNIVALMMLIASGAGLIYLKNLHTIIFDTHIVFFLIRIKITLVFFMVIAACYHSFVVLKTSKRTKFQHIFSKISSSYLLLSSLATLYIAICIRNLL